MLILPYCCKCQLVLAVSDADMLDQRVISQDVDSGYASERCRCKLDVSRDAWQAKHQMMEP